MYSVNSLNIFFDRRPQYDHYRDAALTTAKQKADGDGLLMAGGDWDWLPDHIAQDFFAECERDPMGMFGPDIRRLQGKLVIPYVKLEASNFPDADIDDVVVEGSVGILFGGIPQQFRYDVEVITLPDSGTMYWHPELLRGWSGTVQIVLVADESGLRTLEVRQKS